MTGHLLLKLIERARSPMVAAVLGGGVTAAVFTLAPDVSNGALAVAVLVVFYVVLLVTQIGTRFEALSPLVAFGGLFIAYFGLGSVNRGEYLGIAISQSQWLVYLLAFVSFVAGSLLVGGLTPALAATSTRPALSPQLASSRARTRLYICFIVGVAAIGYSVAASGAPVLSELRTRFVYNSPLGPLFPFMLRLLVICAVLAIAAHYSSLCTTRQQRVINLAILVVSVGAVALFASRSFFVPIVMGWVVFYNYYRRRLRLSRTFALVVTVILALSLFAAWRTAGEQSRSLTQGALQRVGVPQSLYWVGTGYLSILNGPHVLAHVLAEIPAQIPFQHGRFFLGDVLVLAPGKQLLPDQWVAAEVMRTTTVQMSGGVTRAGQTGGIPPTLVGGFYIDFGLAGVAFGMFFVGALLQWLYRVTETRRDPFWVGLYGLVLGYCLLSLYSFISLKPVEVFGWLALAWALMPTRGVSTLRAARE